MTRSHLFSVAAMGVLLVGCDPQKLPECNTGDESCVCTPGIAGQCNDGLVCDEVVGLCRDPLTCEQMLCSAHQQCRPPTKTDDAACLEACEQGYRWNAIGQRCDRVDLTCTPGLEAECLADHRACTVPALGGAPYCGSCLDGFVDENTTCRPRVPCATILDECKAKNRDCHDSWFGPNEDARCGPCPKNTTLDDEGVCRCDQPLKKWDAVGGACIDVVKCTDLNCTGQGQVCIGAVGDQDAYCSEGCPVGTLWSDLLEQCLPCAACEKYPGADLTQGSNGRLLNATGDMCLCATKPGHFFSYAGQIGVFACDHDGDGWVRESARASMFASEPLPTGVDRFEELRKQARCRVGRIERWVLQNDHGETKVVPQSPPVLLFESDRNDDDKLLGQDLAVTNLNQPFGGGAGTAAPGAGLPSAKQINRLTRYCHLAGSDYNDNGAADVSEVPAAAPAKAPADSIKVFNRYSFFAELHTWDFGAWSGSTFSSKKPQQNAAAPTEEKGDLFIRERSRTSGFPLSYGPGDSSWQTCTRKPDQRLDDVESPAGIDFGEPAVAPAWPAWRGMTHSSQFKCLQVAASPDPENTGIVGLGAGLGEWVFNRCTAANPGSEYSPSCSVLPAHELGVGHVRWAAAKFEPYHDTYLTNGVRTRLDSGKSYRFGCVDECAELQDALDVVGVYGPTVSGLGFQDHATVGTCKINPSIGFAADLSCSLQGSYGRLGACDEVCNDGIEGDGNGATPDAIPGGPCSTGLAGACSSGARKCDKGLDRCISTLAADPTKKDHCNGVDEDCDGIVDEDGLDGVAGALVWDGGQFVTSGASCAVPGAVGECVAGGWACKPSGGAECRSHIKPSQHAEVCDNKDNDCDGVVDNSPTDPKLINPVQKSCTITDPAELAKIGPGVIPGSDCSKGEWQCVAGNVKCAAKQLAQTEVCNAVDDDCDGQTDEDDVCVCDLLSQEIWLHGQRKPNGVQVFQGATGSGDTHYNPLRHDVKVTFDGWDASAPHQVQLGLELVVTELNLAFQPEDSKFTWKVPFTESLTKVGDPMPSEANYLTFEHPDAWAQKHVHWKAGPGHATSIRDCKTLFESLPKGVEAVASADPSGSLFKTQYIVKSPVGFKAFPHWTHSLERRVFDLYGASWVSMPTVSAGQARSLPSKIPGWNGSGPVADYDVTWAVDRFELMHHMPLNCDARCDYYKHYPQLVGANCNGWSEWCDWSLQVYGILGTHPNSAGGTIPQGNDNGTRFTITWTDPLKPKHGEFRRIRTGPGWTNGLNDDFGVFFQTWLRYPVRITPKK